jgi:hypothetical protein
MYWKVHVRSSSVHFEPRTFFAYNVTLMFIKSHVQFIEHENKLATVFVLNVML